MSGEDPSLAQPVHRLLAGEVRERFEAYFEELERS